MKVLFVMSARPSEPTASAELIRNIVPLLCKEGVWVDILTGKQTRSDADTSRCAGANVFHADYAIAPSAGKGLEDILQAGSRKIRKMLPGKPHLYREAFVRAMHRELVHLQASRYDVVIPVCSMYDAAEAVLRYKRDVPDTRMVFYQIDPLTENVSYRQLGETYLTAYEQNLYAQSEAVFTTNEIYAHKRSSWNLSNVLPLEFPSMKRYSVQQSVEKPPGEIRCVFAGLLYPTLRNPQYTLELFSQFTNPNIHLYVLGTGQHEVLEEYQRKKLNGRLHCLGSVGAEVCEAWFASADVLVNIGNAMSNQVPSKIFHYFSHGKAILNTCKTENCPTRPYMARYPLACEVIETDNVQTADAERIQRWIEEEHSKHVPFELIEERFRECTPEYVADQFVRVFEQLIKEGSFHDE